MREADSLEYQLSALCLSRLSTLNQNKYKKIKFSLENMQKVICMLWAILVNEVFVDVYLLNDIIYLKFVLYSSDVRHNETLGIEFVGLEGQKVN